MITLRVNGEQRTVDGDPSLPLLWIIRDELHLTGTKFGCGAGLCGACTVHVDGEAVRSCGFTLGEASGKSVVTIEGLDANGNHRVQKAWRAVNVPQCGFCQAGQIMQAAALLAKTPAPTDAQIDEAWSATSVDAAVISASMKPCASRRRGCDMTHISLPFSIENVSRRGVLKGAAYTGAFVFAARMSIGEAQAISIPAYANGGADMPHGVVNDPHVFVSIDPSGTVTIVATRSEMGTGSRTSLPMVVAEEMDADWGRVKIVQAPGDEPKYGNQDTDGSRSLRHFLQPMRQVGVAMRLMLEAAAAKKWGVDVSQVSSSNHEVVNKANGQKLGYGELAADAMAYADPGDGQNHDVLQGPVDIPLHR